MRLAFKLLCLPTLLFSATAYSATLVKEVHETLCTNPILMAEKANEEATLQSLKEARGALFPQVSVFFSGGRESSVSPAVKAFMVDRRTLNREEFNVGLSQLLFDGGRATNTVRSRRFTNLSAHHDVRKVRDGLVLQTAEVYLNVMRNREKVQLAESNVRIHRDVLENMKERFKQGAGRRGEVALAESRLAKAKAELVTFEGDLDSADIKYFTVVGHYPPEQLMMPNQSAKWLPKSLREGLAYSLKNNPELLAAKKNTQSREADVKSIRGRFLPVISFEFSASENSNIDGIEGANRDVLGMVALEYDLFRGGSDLAAVRLARAEQVRTIRQAQQTTRKVIESLRVAWIGMKTAEEQAVVVDENIRAQTIVVKDYKTQFTLGQRPLFNVLDAQNDLFIAKVAKVNARYNEAISYYRILESLGNISLAVVGYH